MKKQKLERWETHKPYGWEMREDAMLIAGLLDALTDLVGGNGKEGDLFSSEAHNKASVAIAKATNQEMAQ